MSANTFRRTSLWVVQVVLAALFLFAGWTKLVMPADALTAGSTLSAEFLRFIGVCELLGGLGLVLPGALRIRRDLTPMAAAGLAIIMVGAVVVTLQQYGAAATAMPAGTLILSALVAYGRRGWIAAPARPGHLSLPRATLQNASRAQVAR